MMPMPRSENASPKSPAGSADAAAAAWSGRARRMLGHFFWYGLGSSLSLGLPQLVLSVICMPLMGVVEFGKFNWALGVVSLVGITPTRGLTNTLLREYARASTAQQPLLLRTGFALAVSVLVLLLSLTVLACLGIWFFGSMQPFYVLAIPILALAFVAQNIVQVGVVDLSITRSFARAAFWQNVGGVLCLLAVPSLPLFGTIGVPIGFTAGHVLAAAILLIVRYRIFVGRPQFNRGMAAGMGTVWLSLSASSFCFMSVRYIHRTALGAYASEEYVSIFFAAVATLDLLMMPVATLGRFGLTILAAHADQRSLPTRLLRLHAAGSVLGVVVFFSLAYWLAPLVVRLLFPVVADQAPVSGIAVGTSISLLMHAGRPFVIKFAPRSTILILAGVVLGAHLVAACALVPRFGLNGAVWSYCIGTGVAGLSWFAAYLRATLWMRSDNSSPESSYPEEL